MNHPLDIGEFYKAIVILARKCNLGSEGDPVSEGIQKKMTNVLDGIGIKQIKEDVEKEKN